MIKEIKYNRQVILFHNIFLSSCKIYDTHHCIHSEYHETVFIIDDNVFTILGYNLMKIRKLNIFTSKFMIEQIIKRYNTDNYTVKIM